MQITKHLRCQMDDKDEKKKQKWELNTNGK